MSRNSKYLPVLGNFEQNIAELGKISEEFSMSSGRNLEKFKKTLK